jgi:Bacterial regulatory protein, Fis family
MTLSESIHRHVTEYLRACLAHTGGNVTHAAKIAGLTRTRFYALCERCEISLYEARTLAPELQTQSKFFAKWKFPYRLTRQSGVRP